MIQLTKNMLLDLEDVFQNDIGGLIENMTDFFSEDYQTIISFYENQSAIYPNSQISKIPSLENDIDSMIDVITSRNINIHSVYVLLDILEESKSRIDTLKNIDIWYRKRNSSQSNLEVDSIIKQGQTLEKISKNVFDENPEQNWIETAQRNRLREEDYDYQGGVPIKVVYQNISPSFIESVVKPIISSIDSYGTDISVNFSYENGDLKKVDGLDCLKQSAKILSGLKRGDNPEFYFLGIDKKKELGVSQNTFLFPTIFRQLQENFSTDDSFSAIQLDSIEIIDNKAFANATLFTRIGDVEAITLSI